MHLSTSLNRFLFPRFENVAWSLYGASAKLGTSNREIGDTFFLFIVSPFCAVERVFKRLCVNARCKPRREEAGMCCSHKSKQLQWQVKNNK